MNKPDWIIECLKEIRAYSGRNGFLELAEQLDDAIVIAAREIAVASSARSELPLE